MAGKGGSSSLKRPPSPAFWPIHRKEFTWVVRPTPGPHPLSASIPLGVALRDILSLAKTGREAKIILSDGRVKVDGRLRRTRKFPIGLMDVVEIPDANQQYRVLPVAGRGLALVKITKEDAKVKLCRIQNRTTLENGRTQFNLHDGRTIPIDVTDTTTAATAYARLDSLRIAIPNQRILEHYKFGEGNYGLITGGRNLGRHGKITAIAAGAATGTKAVTIEDQTNNTFRTSAENVFVVGKEKPVIRLEAS